MPNIPANRLSTQFDFRGPAFTVSAEELSGIEALRLACRALGRGEIDAALCGAVDLSDEPVHRAAAAALLPADRQEPGDGAVALVLKRKADAEAAGDRIYAHIPADLGGAADAVAGDAVRRRFGHAHAASGLLEVLAAVVEGATRSEVTTTGMRPAIAPPGTRARSVRGDAFAGQRGDRRGQGADQRRAVRQRPRRRSSVSGARQTPTALHAALEAPAGQLAEGGAFRLAIVARDEPMLVERIAACRAALANGATPAGRGVFFRNGAPLGEAAIVFAGANAYPDMGRDLFLAFPEIGDALAARFPVAAEVAASLYGEGGAAFIAEPFGTLKAASLICQAHARSRRPPARVPAAHRHRPLLGRDQRALRLRRLARHERHVPGTGRIRPLRRASRRPPRIRPHPLGPRQGRAARLAELAGRRACRRSGGDPRR